MVGEESEPGCSAEGQKDQGRGEGQGNEMKDICITL